MFFYILRRLFWTLIVVVVRDRNHVHRLLPAAGRRSRSALRRQEPDAGAARADPAPPAASTSRGTSSSASSSRTFVTGDQYGWPGLGYSYGGDVVRPRPDRERAPRGRSSLIIGAAIIWLTLRRRDRRHLRRQAAHDRRPRRDGLRALRDLGARLLARPDGALHLLAASSAGPAGTGYVALTDEHHRLVLAPDPALDRARAALRGDLRPHDAQQPARDARGGLHPHGAREGALGAPGHLQARPAREPDADRDDVRPRHRAARRRRRHHRVGVQHPGPRLPRDQRRPHAGSADGRSASCSSPPSRSRS